MISSNYIKGNVVVTIGESIYTKSGVSKEDYVGVLQPMCLDGDEDGVIEFMAPTIQTQREKAAKFGTLKEHGELGIMKYYGGSVTIPSISDLTVPQNLVEAIATAYAEDNVDKLEAYTNFWTFASANPDHRVRENLFWFLQHHHMHISRSGMFAAFRNVVPKEYAFPDMDQEMAEFVARQYAEVKMILGKDPGNFEIWTMDGNNEYCWEIVEDQKVLGGATKVGNLLEMYNEITDRDGLTFTDQHSGTTHIRLGKEVSIPRSECDSNQDNTCSRGLVV